MTCTGDTATRNLRDSWFLFLFLLLCSIKVLALDRRIACVSRVGGCALREGFEGQGVTNLLRRAKLWNDLKTEDDEDAIRGVSFEIGLT